MHVGMSKKLIPQPMHKHAHMLQAASRTLERAHSERGCGTEVQQKRWSSRGETAHKQAPIVGA